MSRFIIFRNVCCPVRSGRMRCSRSQIGRMRLSKNATDVTKRRAAVAFSRPDVRVSAAAYMRSLPSQVLDFCRGALVVPIPRRTKMNHQRVLLTAAVLICISSGASAKTAKECTAEWRADKVGMQARGTTEKAYVDQCKGGAEPSAPASAKPAEAKPAAPTPRQATATGAKTAKDCTAEWRADKAGMKARGVTERAYVEQCKAAAAPTASAPAPKPSVATP